MATGATTVAAKEFLRSKRKYFPRYKLLQVLGARREISGDDVTGPRRTGGDDGVAAHVPHGLRARQQTGEAVRGGRHRQLRGCVDVAFTSPQAEEEPGSGGQAHGGLQR